MDSRAKRFPYDRREPVAARRARALRDFWVDTVSPADDPAGIIKKSYEYYYSGHYHDVLALAEAALASNPWMLEGYASKALSLIELGEMADAFAIAEATTFLAPKAAIAQSILGLCYGRRGHEAKARRHLERAIALAPDDARWPYNYACFAADFGYEEECRDRLEELVRRFPNAVGVADRDPSFAKYKSTPWFRALVARTPKDADETTVTYKKGSASAL